ncbi:MAG TPA: hypothetical protein DEP72_04085 [Clostridiales bacterium]|nr:MAG: hypothetical protein A2Y18_04365 [Clostridiales bacterium GWD2_32_19]HCC07322.1 hypothetical protein [Clostridiales bacterium]
MSQFVEKEIAEKYISKWQDILRLRDWDIKLHIVEEEWRKTGDIKIDVDDKKAILMLNNYNPKQTNLEELIIHEFLHLKLYGMDQMTEELIHCVFGDDLEDAKFKFAYDKFMTLIETTVEDLAKGYLGVAGENKNISFGRIQK